MIFKNVKLLPSKQYLKIKHIKELINNYCNLSYWLELASMSKLCYSYFHLIKISFTLIGLIFDYNLQMY